MAVTKSEGDGDHPANHYLVVEDPEQPSTWHLRVKDVDGKLDHGLMGACWAALHEGYRGNKYEGPNKTEAIAKLKKLYASEDMTPPGEQSSTFLIDDFMSVVPGQPYRLFPFGRIVKGGVEHLITPEVARSFKLPHFKPPIKLGSHEDVTPAGGHIVGLEVREDGLYALPEFVPAGEKALADGAYRYHSPEVIWEDEGLGTPDGGMIPGPLIIGDALLHTPHLGEAAALYRVEQRSNTMEEMVSVPKNLWEKFLGLFVKGVEPVAPVVREPEDYAAAKAALIERDALKAEKAKMDAEAARGKVLHAIGEEFKKTEFGMAYVELGKAEEAATMLASMSEEARAWCMRTFGALSKQIDESKLTGERGSAGGSAATNPTEAFDAAVKAKASAAKISYVEAYEIVKTEQPDLFNQALGKNVKGA